MLYTRLSSLFLLLVTLSALSVNSLRSAALHAAPPASSASQVEHKAEHKAALYLTATGALEPLSFDADFPHSQLDQHPDLPEGLLISLDFKGALKGDVFVVMQGKTPLAKRSVKVPYQEMMSPRYTPVLIKKVGWCEDVSVVQLRAKKVIAKHTLKFACME